METVGRIEYAADAERHSQVDGRSSEAKRSCRAFPSIADSVDVAHTMCEDRGFVLAVGGFEQRNRAGFVDGVVIHGDDAVVGKRLECRQKLGE